MSRRCVTSCEHPSGRRAVAAIASAARGRLILTVPPRARSSGGTRTWSRLIRLLVETDDVSGRIPKPGGNFRCVDADRLHDLAAVGAHRLHRLGDAVNHDVHEQADRKSTRLNSSHVAISYAV